MTKIKSLPYKKDDWLIYVSGVMREEIGVNHLNIAQASSYSRVRVTKPDGTPTSLKPHNVLYVTDSKEDAEDAIVSARLVWEAFNEHLKKLHQSQQDMIALQAKNTTEVFDMWRDCKKDITND